MNVFVLFLVLCATVQLISAKLSYSGGSFIERHVLQQYGAARDSFGTMLTVPEGEVLKATKIFSYKRRIITKAVTTYAQVQRGYNISCAVDLEGGLGYSTFTLIAITKSKRGVKKYILKGSYEVLGIQFLRRGTIVSGDAGTGITFQSYNAVLRALQKGGVRIRIRAYGGRRKMVASKYLRAHVRAMKRGERKFIDKEGIVVSDQFIKILPKRYHFSKHGVKIALEHTGIIVDGETAETEILVKFAKGAVPPPPVLTTRDSSKTAKTMRYSIYVGKTFCLNMFNINSSLLERIVLRLGAYSAPFLRRKSSLKNWSQRVCFSMNKKKSRALPGRYPVSVIVMYKGKRPLKAVEEVPVVVEVLGKP